jgi:hypothetical protein
MTLQDATSPLKYVDVHSYVYVIVRKDFSFEQQMVQSNHASVEAGVRYKTSHDIASLIMLEVPNKDALELASERLRSKGIAHHLFYEPDFGMGHSALATRPLVGKERSIMRCYPLYKFDTQIKIASQHFCPIVLPASLESFQ